MKVYLVKNAWYYEGCTDDYANCYEDGVEKIFDSEDKAIKYIQDEIRKLVDNHYVSISHVPSESYIKEHSDEIIFDQVRNETSYYHYEEMEVY